MSDRTWQRELFRVRYPDDAPARITVFAQEFEIVDCSEAGLRYKLNGAAAPTSQSVDGKIRFAAGGTADVTGFVVRKEDEYVALKFAKAISAVHIMNEQRWLRDHAAKQRAAAAQLAAK